MVGFVKNALGFGRIPNGGYHDIYLNNSVNIPRPLYSGLTHCRGHILINRLITSLGLGLVESQIRKENCSL